MMISEIRKVMFVCNGNTCRSPMAEYLFRSLCGKKGLNIEVVSRAALDLPIEGKENIPKLWTKTFLMPEVEEVLLEYDPAIKGLNKHIPTSWSAYDMKTSDLILTMDCHIRDRALLFSWLGIENIERKVYTLKEYAGFFYDPEVEDPIMLTPMMGKMDVKMLEDLCKKEDDKGLFLGNNTFYNKLYRKSYSICRDEILECLLIILEGKEASHEQIIKYRLPTRDVMLRGYSW